MEQYRPHPQTCSHSTLMWREMVGLMLLFLLNGNSCWQFNREFKSPLLVSAWEGSCVLFPCEYVKDRHESQLINLTWFKDPVYRHSEKKWSGTQVFTPVGGHKEVAESFRNRTQYGGDLSKNCTLLIQDLLVTDSGGYSLMMEDGDDMYIIQRSPYLNVIVSPPAPRIVVPSPITESQAATVTCSINYSCHEKYPIELHWDGPVKGSNTTSYEETTRTLRTSNSLSFMPSWEHDKKPLRCNLRNNKDPTKTSSSEIILDVKHSPKHVRVITEGSSATMKEGDGVTLRCLVNSSNPAVTEYRWSKDNSWQAPNKTPTMEITDASAKHAGKYSCEASNSVGTGKSEPLEVVVHSAETTVSTFVIVSISAGVIIFLLVLLVFIIIRSRRKRAAGNNQENVVYSSVEHAYAALDKTQISPDYEEVKRENRPA